MRLLAGLLAAGPVTARLIPLSACLAMALAGCQPPEDEESGPDLSKLVPVKGTIKIDGKPTAGVVVTFLPTRWAAANGETKPDGTYELQTGPGKGALPGEYKVAISYLVSTDGKPQGLGPRSSMSPPPSMSTAKERLAAEYSDLGRTKLKATVGTGPEGNSFDFDVPSIPEKP